MRLGPRCGPAKRPGGDSDNVPATGERGEKREAIEAPHGQHAPPTGKPGPVDRGGSAARSAPATAARPGNARGIAVSVLPIADFKSAIRNWKWAIPSLSPGRKGPSHASVCVFQ